MYDRIYIVMKESIFLDHTADVFDPSIRKRVNFSFVLSRTRVIIKFNALVKDTFFLFICGRFLPSQEEKSLSMKDITFSESHFIIPCQVYWSREMKFNNAGLSFVANRFCNIEQVMQKWHLWFYFGQKKRHHWCMKYRGLWSPSQVVAKWSPSSLHVVTK